MVLPGLLVPPFADERYDDASLATRLGFVMAHEFMHVTAYESQWSEAYATHLLGDYPESTHVEAIADLGAAASLCALQLRLERDRSAPRSRSSSAGAWAGCPCWMSPPVAPAREYARRQHVRSF